MNYYRVYIPTQLHAVTAASPRDAIDKVRTVLMPNAPRSVSKYWGAVEVDDADREKPMLSEVAILREALAAAEAECAEWRKRAGVRLPDTLPVTMGCAIAMKGDAETMAVSMPSADANDATRARLGLPKIGEVRDEA